jgi:outer membrane protein assembly factor BamB
MHSGIRLRRLPFILWLLLPICVAAADWPQFLGPTRNGIYTGAPLLEHWDDSGPKIVWQKKIGSGFGSPVVANGRLVVFHRLGTEEIVECLNATNGQTVWKYACPAKFRDPIHFDDGPRSTPAISEGKVYSFGANGLLLCLDLETGAKVWSADTRADFHAAVPWFGMVCSPLIEGDSLLLSIGSTNKMGIAAFDKKTGAILWQSTSDRCSGSSPVCATIHNRRYALFLTYSRLVGLNPADGKIQFQFPWMSHDFGPVVAATPVVVSDSIFISAIYSLGSALLRVNAAGDGVEKLWGSHQLSAHYQTGIYKDGFLYAPDGHQEEGPSLCCIELATGKVQWKNEEFGQANLLLANDDLLLLTHQGELIFAPASPREFKVKARAQILPFLVRAYPAISDGFLFGRATGKLVCVDLRK